MTKKHAFLSASGAPAWTRCEVKPWREKDEPDERSPEAEEGVKAHALLELLLQQLLFSQSGEEIASQLLEFNADSEMLAYTQKTKELVCSFIDDEKIEIYPEQELDISFITGEDSATGTADVVITKGTELIVVDLKYGRGVLVEASGNEQLLIYGAAAIEKYDLTGDIKTLRLIISQPRLNHIDEWVLSTEEVNKQISKIRQKAKRILAAKGGGPNLHATPGEKQCRFCKVKGSCPDYRGFALGVVTDDFVNLEKEEQFLNKVKNAELRLATSDDRHLATCMDAVGMIENWCTAVKKEIQKRLLKRSFTDPRWKLVQGRPGNRKWTDPEEVKTILHDAGTPMEFTLEPSRVISPAQLEKKLIGSEYEFVLDKVQKCINRVEGGMVLASVHDKRPAVVEDVLDFKPIESEFVDALVGLSKGD